MNIADHMSEPLSRHDIIVFRQQAEDELRIAEYNCRTARKVAEEAERRKREVVTYLDWLASITHKAETA